MNARFYLAYDIKITLKSHFCCKNVIILSICKERCYGRHNISRKSINHGIISLPDQTSYEPVHEISNNVVCSTSKALDQPAHTRRLIRAFASRLNIL